MHHGVHRYCVIFKNSVMPEFKYSSHSAEYFTRVRTKRSIKDGMGGHIGRITNAVQQHKMYENKQKKELKALKKQNNILYGTV